MPPSYDGEVPSKLKNLFKGKTAAEVTFGSGRKEAKVLAPPGRPLASPTAREYALLVGMAQKMGDAPIGRRVLLSGRQ